MHTEEERRLIVERIDASFTDSIHNDEEQALSLLVERCRLVVYGSLAVIAGSAAAVASMSPPPNSWLVGGAIILLQAGAFVAWHGLGFAETLRHHRVVRRYLERSAMLSARFGGADPLYPAPAAGEVVNARADEKRSTDRVRDSTTYGLFAAGCGFACMLGAFVQVIDERRVAVNASKAAPAHIQEAVSAGGSTTARENLPKPVSTKAPSVEAEVKR